MKARRLILLLVELVLINGTTWAVVTGNYRNGVYPDDGDTIAIPILSTLLGSCLIMLLLVIMELLRGVQLSDCFASRGWTSRLALGSLWTTTHLSIALFALYGTLYWAIPKHYLICLSFIALLFTDAWFFVLDAKKLLSNYRLNPRARSARPPA
jgi:hypothetical protein